MFKLTVVFLSLAVLGIGGVAYANQERSGPTAYTLVDPNGGRRGHRRPHERLRRCQPGKPGPR